MGTRGQLLLHLQYDYRHALPNSQKQQRMLYGARVNVGSPGLNGFLELSGNSDLEYHNDPKGRWTGGFEFRLADGLWASTGLGAGIGPEDTNNRILLIANLRWAVADAARSAPF